MQQNTQILHNGLMPINGMYKTKLLKTNKPNLYSTYLFNTPNMQPCRAGQAGAYYGFLYACWLSNNGLIKPQHVQNFAYAYTVKGLMYFSFFRGSPNSYNVFFATFATSKKQAKKLFFKYYGVKPNVGVKISPYITPV